MRANKYPYYVVKNEFGLYAPDMGKTHGNSGWVHDRKLALRFASLSAAKLSARYFLTPSRAVTVRAKSNPAHWAHSKRVALIQLPCVIVASKAYPGLVSLRETPDQQSATGLRRAMKAAGFVPGDKVVIRLV